jgi:hypothetical protein
MIDAIERSAPGRRCGSGAEPNRSEWVSLDDRGDMKNGAMSDPIDNPTVIRLSRSRGALEWTRTRCTSRR